jgi:hypothetical protein
MRNVTSACQGLFVSIVGGVLLVPVLASAQNVGAQAQAEGNATVAPTTTATVGAGTPPQNLPPPQSDDDPQPTAPSPTVAATGITEQAGIGGTQAYARAGVLELGGFANLTSAKDYFSLGFNPTIGYFFMDNIEISAIIGVSHSSQTVRANGESTKASQTLIMALAEPSFHIPFTQTVYGFLGVGFGVSSQSGNPGPDAGAGFAIAPRLGVNVMVGRSGIFTPALQGLYQTTEAVSTPQGAVVAVKSSFGLQAGYTVMW